MSRSPGMSAHKAANHSPEQLPGPSLNCRMNLVPGTDGATQ